MPSFTAEVPVYEDSPHTFTRLDELAAAVKDDLPGEVLEILDRFGGVHAMFGEVVDYLSTLDDFTDADRAISALANAYGLIMLVDDEYVEMKREQLAELEASDDS